MTTAESIITVAIIAFVTLLTRLLPFILFPEGKRTPGFVEYLGRVLPYAVMGMLVVYCFKSVNFLDAPFALPEIIAAVFVVLVHKRRHNMLLSIGGGTLVYMLLIRLIH